MKTKIILIIIIATFFSNCNGQTNGKYLNIESTRLSIIPPIDFYESKSIIGLEKNEKTATQVMDLVGGNFESNTATFTITEFKKKGISVLEFKDLKIDGFNAKYANIKGADESERALLVFGDSTFSAMVIAFFPSSSRNELLPEIEKSFLKIKYDKSLIIDPFANSNLKVEENDSKFKFAKVSANMFIFSENGIVKKSYDNEPMVMISTYPFDKTMSKEKLIDQMQDGLIQQGFIKKEIKNISKKSINGYDTMEVEFYCEHKSKYKLTFITALIEKDKALVFYGITESNYAENIIEFKKLSSKIKIK